ncbi:MAG: Oxidoreductase domain protein [Verrucomicrobiaceae bacterium]|nr:Oxidoreductase domain protein [Verrucomicrobiaceae bacterium]
MHGIGLIGLGFMGATHLKAWQQVPRVRIAALCNPSGRHLDGDFTDVAGNLGANDPLKLDMTEVHGYRSFDEMLADPEVTVVDICTPTHTHRDLALAALKAGKHVLCEKPMARTSEEAREMTAAAREAGRVLMPAMCLRFWPGWLWLKEAVDSNRYGNVLSARFTRLAEPPAWGLGFFFDGAKSGGALLDLHIHDTDFVRYLFGHPLKVESAGYTKVSGAIDHVATRYHVASGALVYAEGSWAMARGFGFRMAYVVNFEHATAEYDSARLDNPLQLSINGEKQIIDCDGPSGHLAQMTHFIEALDNGTDPSIVTAEDGVAALEICEAEAACAAQGKPGAP